ncbi:hypothetical protein QBC32DRAFT_378141 [Pseudoneurospora amorphoporcata]|uniref:F-box domain-containing protein n=1 Tax=Pseudoneurospora amorphoporcata TaxID=241081 RepID=A0AAN6SDJ7_9PEZI|nr:hypothetical protein QBC32DRAFT_378141 [Pseudoneurospora amorphoporcata]
MFPQPNRNSHIPSQHKVYRWLINQQQFMQAGAMASVDSPSSVRMSPALSTKTQSNIFQTPPRHSQHLDLLPPLRPSKRTASYGGHQDQDPEIDDSSDKFRRRRFSSLLEVRPAKRPRTNPLPPPPQPPRNPANRRPTSAQPARAFRQVLRAPAVQEDVEIAALDQPTETPFPLLRLPYEIREQILRHLLVSDKPVYVKRLWTEQVRSTRRSTRGRGHWGNGEGESQHTIDTTILRSSRQMLAEGSSLLYSQNRFVYLLRDPAHAQVDFASMLAEALKDSPKEVVSNGKRKRKADTQVTTGSYGLHEINIAKYGHLLRHLSIELEPNRSGKEYRELMERALDVLASFDRRGRHLLAGQVVDAKTPRIFLHTLTITVSPENDHNNRRRSKNSPNGNPEPSTFSSSAIELFDSRSTVMHALCRIDTQFLRFNMHIDEDAHGEDDDEFAVNDHLMKEQRAKRGEEAVMALQTLKHRMYAGCENPNQAIDDGLWEDKNAADVRRRKERAEFEARLEGVDRPARDDAHGEDDDEEEAGSDEETDEDDDDDDDYDSNPRKRKQSTRGRGRS